MRRNFEDPIVILLYQELIVDAGTSIRARQINGQISSCHREVEEIGDISRILGVVVDDKLARPDNSYQAETCQAKEAVYLSIANFMLLKCLFPCLKPR